MRVALFGCGRMGLGCAHSLATDPAVTRLTLFDTDPDRAHDTAHRITPYATGTVTVATDPDAARAGHDVLATALPWAACRDLIGTAARTGVPIAGIARPHQDDLAMLGDLDRPGTSTVLLPIGLEPGLTELLAAELAERLDYTRSVEIFCGGIPSTPREPVGHVSFFGGESAHHLPIAQRDSLATRHGRLVTVPRFSGLEERHFDGIGTLQAYHDGMVPWLRTHPALSEADCTQKTVRWPGFGEAVTRLAQLGLLGEEPVDVDGARVVPRRLVERVLAPRVMARPADTDLVVLEVIAHGALGGRPHGLRVRLTDTHDPATGLAAMTRCTGFALAAASLLLAGGEVGGAGWQMPHLAIRGAARGRLLDTLRRHGIRIAELFPAA
ncbi:Saccharopine dehydrogenase, NADP-dependent [Micromonospora nigra]|uniref:Saccharopine dehydrogenase, NADP-dependent n=1 Tax=Micromonospora nigra TaxID=145857 RepID=A0A1C6RCR9_9ACTN|nr:saccharopine dehydrogenase C-terminal domain-containing protein [Micromonospora nigra]SCL14945.1 Saccharopine dehydrogenase, NADP-dependent [Micromonospora nigra]